MMANGESRTIRQRAARLHKPSASQSSNYLPQRGDTLTMSSMSDRLSRHRPPVSMSRVVVPSHARSSNEGPRSASSGTCDESYKYANDDGN